MIPPTAATGADSKPESGTTDNSDDISVDPVADKLPDFADWLPESVHPYWETVAQYPVIGAIVIAAIFYLAALIVRTVFVKSFTQLASRTQTDIDNAIIAKIRKPIFATIFLFGLTLAVKFAQFPFPTNWLINLLLSFIILSWMRATLSISGDLLHALGNNAHRYEIIEERTIPLFDLIAKVFIILLASYCLLMIWGINPVGWLASAGIVGIAVGFAAKDTLANLFSGFFIVADSPYSLGDYINLDTGERGRVTHIGIRSTRILTRDDVEITVPNAVIGNAKIVNESGGPWEKLRIRCAVGAAYGSDVDHVCEVLMQVIQAHEGVTDDPAPRVRLRAFGASSLDFEVLGWIDKPELRGRIRHELLMSIYKAFAEAGIEIPYTKQDLYIKEMPDRS